MNLHTSSRSDSTPVTYNERSRAALESVPAKSPHRKYLVLLAMHLMHTDDMALLCEAADCSERTFHYAKKRLSEDDGVILNYERSAGRYLLIQSGVLDLPRVAELMKRYYPLPFAHIERLPQTNRETTN